MPTVYFFPGQGSQKLKMGAECFDRFPEQVRLADQELGYSIKDLCLEDPQKQLDQTQFTQPALFIVSALSYQAKLADTGNQAPDYVLGHSVGEYAALFAAGVFDLSTGIRLVKKRGEIMSKAMGGGMAAVIGMPPARITELMQTANLTGIDIANFNSPEQTVISGPVDDIDRVIPVLESGGARMVVKLKVSGAFHSRRMVEASRDFGAFLESIAFHEPRIPVISNLEAGPYTGSRVRELLTRQVCSPVRWTESIQYLHGLGEMSFEEIGPGKVLTRLLTQIKKT